jgi:hypothetical protein
MRKLPAVLRGLTLFLLLITPVVLSRSLDGLWSLLLVPFLALLWCVWEDLLEPTPTESLRRRVDG